MCECWCVIPVIFGATNVPQDALRALRDTARPGGVAWPATVPGRGADLSRHVLGSLRQTRYSRNLRLRSHSRRGAWTPASGSVIALRCRRTSDAGNCPRWRCNCRLRVVVEPVRQCEIVCYGAGATEPGALAGGTDSQEVREAAIRQVRFPPAALGARLLPFSHTSMSRARHVHAPYSLRPGRRSAGRLV